MSDPSTSVGAGTPAASITSEQMFAISRPGALVDALRDAFGLPAVIPERQHYTTNPDTHSTLLVMPAWTAALGVGVKVATVVPDNATRGLPTIQGLYLLLDAGTGRMRAVLDARALTSLRTAAVSALASSYLSRPDSTRLVIIGTGALAPHMVRAHASVRRITHVTVWGRDRSKCAAVVGALEDVPVEIGVADDVAAAVAAADIVSCATSSNAPVLRGMWLRPGTHVDLVGSFAPSMREADDDVIRRGRLFVDTDTALKESGDLLSPTVAASLPAEVPTLHDLVTGRTRGRTEAPQITVFKSVGTALADIAAAAHFVKLLDPFARSAA